MSNELENEDAPMEEVNAAETDNSAENTEEKESADNASENGGDKQNELADKIAALTEENSQLKDQLLRKQADFENYRRRMVREKEDAIKFGKSGLLTDLVEVIDNFERAIKSSEEGKDYDSFHSGIVMIEQQFTNMLEQKYGLSRFAEEGDEFDPQKHEAMTMQPSDEYDVQSVVTVFQKGYMLHDRVLRPAKVVVSMPVEKEENSNEGDK